MLSAVNFTKHLKKKCDEASHLRQKTEAKGIFHNLFYKANVNLIPKPDRDHNKENLNIHISYNIYVKIFNELVANQIQQCIKNNML